MNKIKATRRSARLDTSNDTNLVGINTMKNVRKHKESESKNDAPRPGEIRFKGTNINSKPKENRTINLNEAFEAWNQEKMRWFAVSGKPNDIPTDQEFALHLIKSHTSCGPCNITVENTFCEDLTESGAPCNITVENSSCEDLTESDGSVFELAMYSPESPDSTVDDPLYQPRKKVINSTKTIEKKMESIDDVVKSVVDTIVLVVSSSIPSILTLNDSEEEPDDKEDNRLRCNICLKTFQRKSNYSRHMKLHGVEITKRSSETKLHKCDECEKQFFTKRTLKAHLKLHRIENEKTQKYICEICGKEVSNSRVLQWHVAEHTRPKRFFCEFCNKGFTNKTHFMCHRRTHTKELLCLCDVCGQGFHNKINLDRHSRIHTNERPFKCPVCNKTFRTSSAVSIHKKIHTNTREYVCPECAKRFISSSQLKRHRWTHAQEKPHRCDICHKGFTQKGNLKIHLRVHMN